MTHIDHDLLVAKGTINALLALSTGDGSTTAELSEEMEVSKGTARDRLSTLAEEGFVSEAAELREGQPTRVYEITQSGKQVAELLDDLITDAGPSRQDDADASTDSAEA